MEPNEIEGESTEEYDFTDDAPDAGSGCNTPNMIKELTLSETLSLLEELLEHKRELLKRASTESGLNTPYKVPRKK
jgi:hypothetical protein